MISAAKVAIVGADVADVLAARARDRDEGDGGGIAPLDLI
jgi:hypothetical protein